MPRKKEKPASALPKEATTIEQVVSVQVSGGLNGTLFSAGITALKDAFFSSVKPVSVTRQNHISGIAPSNGTGLFLIVEYIPKAVMRNEPIKLQLINRDRKSLIDKGRLMFESSGVAGEKTYSIIDGEIGSWEITTKPAPEDILAKARRFENEAMTYRDTERSIELIPEEKLDVRLDSIRVGSTYVEPLPKMFEKNPIFAQFVKEHCGGDLSVTSVSEGLCRYLEEQGIGSSKFAKDMNEGYGLFYNLSLLKNLHPELKPMLNVSRIVARETGAERVPIDVGSMIARVPIDRQLEVWNKVKGLHSRTLISAAINKFR
jgi:hypothetical protein